MTISPACLRSVLIYIFGSCLIAKSTLFYSQKSYALDNKLYDHLSSKKPFNSFKKIIGQRNGIRMILSGLHFITPRFIRQFYGICTQKGKNLRDRKVIQRLQFYFEQK